jgi:hypothetical protein
MKEYPSIPRAANAPEGLFEEGHLWLFEKVDGANLRFQLQEAGFLRFGDRSRVYDPDDVPDPYQHAVRHVRNRLDREALRAAVDDVESVVFFGEAMHRHTIDYDWERTPSFLGFDVWAADEGFRPLASIADIFEGLGLQAVNTFDREVRARDFDPESYTIPASAWYDGPAEGVVVRNKRGERAKVLHPDFREVDETVPVDAPAEALAAKFATRRRFEKLAGKLEDRGERVTVDRLYELALEDIVREEHRQLYHGRESVDMQAFRSEVAALTREFLDDRG